MTDGRTVINIDPDDLKLDKTAQMLAACWSAEINIHHTLGHELHFETLAVWMGELVAACMAHPGDDIDRSYDFVKISLVSSPWVAQIHSTNTDGTINVLPSFKTFHTIFDAYKWIRNEPKMVGDMMVLIHKHEDGTILHLNKTAQESYTWTPVDF